MVLGQEVMDTSPAPEVAPGIHKLRGRENYSVWKFQMKNLLLHEGLWFPIAGYPEGDTTDEATRVGNDLKALSKINLMLGLNCIPHTMRAQTAAEAWHSLENVFEDKGRVHLLQKLLSVKMEDHATLEDYISEVTMISEQIAETGNPVDDEIVGVVLLKGFSNNDCFKPLIMSLESSGTTLTSDIAKHWLMMSYNDHLEPMCQTDQFDSIEEERHTFVRWFKKTSTFVETAVHQKLLRQKAVENSPHQNGNRKRVICFKCHQPGHKKKECTVANSADTAGPSNVSETTSVPRQIGKAIIETATETLLVRGAIVIGGAVGGAAASVATVAAKVIKRK